MIAILVRHCFVNKCWYYCVPISIVYYFSPHALDGLINLY